MTGSERRPIPGFALYFADSDGDIWLGNKRLRQTLKRHERYKGSHYLIVRLRANRRNGYAWYFVHRLILIAFMGPPPEGKDQSRHLNGTTIDNRPDNLVWGTAAENADDRIKHGTAVRGEDHPGAKLTEVRVREIIESLKRGRPQKYLAREFMVSRQTISSIKCRTGWKYLKENQSGCE